MGTTTFNGQYGEVAYVTTTSPIAVTVTGSSYNFSYQVRGTDNTQPSSLKRKFVLSMRFGNGSASETTTNTVSSNTTNASGSYTLQFSNVFNSSNKTSKTASANVYVDRITINYSPGGGPSSTIYSTKAVSTINCTLNVPPQCTATTTSSGTYYAGLSTYSVNISGLTAFYGGTISSVVLNVGGRTASRTNSGALSVIVPTTSGTYTPTVTVTDSRGQTKAYSLTAITVTQHTVPTLTPTVTSSAPYYNVGTPYSVSVSDVTAYDGATISSIALKLGVQEDVKTSSFTSPFTINPDTVGSFIPKIVVTDSYGAIKEYPLSQIDVSLYSVPSVSFGAIRTNTDGESDDEGESAVINATFAWTNEIVNLVQPTVVIKDLDGIVQSSAAVTWYSTWTSTDGVSNAISNWSSVSSMPIYALVKNTSENLFDPNKSYYVSITPHDNMPNDGNTITQTLGGAFYTVDFLAGGHGIAFGQPATEEGFFCNMDATFKEDLVAQDMTAQEVQDFVDNLEGGGGIDINVVQDIQTVFFTDGSQTISGGGAVTREGLSLASVVPSGYTPIFATFRYAGNYQTVCYTCTLSTTGLLTYQLANRSSSSITITPAFQILCVKKKQ